MLDWIRDIPAYLCAVASHWWAIMTGGFAVLLLGLLGALDLVEARPWMWWSIGIGAFFFASFLAWRDEHSQPGVTSVGCDVLNAQAGKSGGGTIDGDHFSLLMVSLQVRFRNGAPQPLTVLGMRGRLLNLATGERIDQRQYAEAVNEAIGGKALDRDEMVLVPPGGVSKAYWWRFVLSIPDGFHFTSDHVFEATMTAMNQRDLTVRVRAPWDEALQGTVNATPLSREFQ